MGSTISGGFHFYADSSIGKSTTSYVALSVQGSPDSLESWSMTETGAEEVAASHNDSLLIFDELKSLDKDPIKAAQLASKITYAIALGKDKRRSKNYTKDRLYWRTVIISSGELSLAQHAAEGGAIRMHGEEVRLVDVPGDAGNNLGIYEKLPKDATSASEYAEALGKNCRQYYGAAQRVFLKKLTAQMADDYDALKIQITVAMQEFMDKHDIDGSKGREARMAKRFALAYAGGKLAVNYKILPFTEKDLMKGISKCYIDAVKAQPKSDAELIQIAYDSIDKKLKKDSGFIDICKNGHGHSIEELKAATGYRAIVKGKKVRVIKPDVLKSWIPDDKVRKLALNRFVAEDRLVCDAQGKQTMQVQSNLESSSDAKKLPRAYCFLPKPNPKKIAA